METGTVDGPLTGRPSLASSWDAACGALAQRLHLTWADLGARDADWEELLAPPDTSQDLVVLKRNLNSQDENPCFLYLRCDPGGGEEIVSIGILSSARNMEVYLGEEYCGTSRGKNVCNVLDNSQDLVVLKRNLNSQDENPCFLYLRCDPGGGEEIVSIGILSSARNMEVYLGEEYCGTSRGKNVCNVLDNRSVDKLRQHKGLEKFLG
ncbi:Uncharacterized protein Cadr_000009672 [Camelus dromedarius]|uniref:Uncharacterized protein n=1 Tax=Camelus dromedarius TaxID=9838 RepID=A0A5N4DIV6_CAMDR|nr:Uncharacterized protein Cadr_000009672 [Camelus dromedarius]